MPATDSVNINGMDFSMPVLRGSETVAAWADSVHALCSSDPTYRQNRACIAVSDTLRVQDVVTINDVYCKTVAYWKKEAGLDVRATVGDLTNQAILVGAKSETAPESLTGTGKTLCREGGRLTIA